MAPPTGPRAGVGSARGRGNTRGGGIQKRSTGPRTRTDRDGDVAMDAPARGGGTSRGRKSNTTSRVTRTAQNIKAYGSDAFTVEPGRRGVSLNSSKARFAHTTILQVTGLDLAEGDKRLPALLAFLERKASKNQTKNITVIKVCCNT